MIRTVRATFTLLVMVAVTLPTIPVQMICNRLNLPFKRTLPILWHRLAARMIGLKITVKGEMTKDRPLLLTANHISWLDIVTLGASGPLCFIAKQEVSGWPAFSTLAKLQRTVFVNRERRSTTGNKIGEIGERLADGDAMVLFAEGTSTAGNHVLPFRSALIGAVHKAASGDADVWVQPVAITYTHLQGMAATTHERALTGFYGDMDMAPHLWAVLREAAIDVTVVFGKPRRVSQTTDRKGLTKTLEDDVRTMRAAIRRGYDLNAL